MSFYLETADIQSTLTFGAINHDYIRAGESLHYQYLVNNYYWSIDISGAQVEGEDCFHNHAHYAIVDSGTTELLLTPQDYHSVITKIASTVTDYKFTDFGEDTFGWATACENVT